MNAVIEPVISIFLRRPRASAGYDSAMKATAPTTSSTRSSPGRLSPASSRRSRRLALIVSSWTSAWR